jgi:hypothetical protein
MFGLEQEGYRRMVMNLYGMMAQLLILPIGLKEVQLKKLEEIVWKCNQSLRENFLIYLIQTYAVLMESGET